MYVSLYRVMSVVLVAGFLPACPEKFCSFCCQTFVGYCRCWPLVVWAGMLRVCVGVCVTRSAIGPITLNECFADDRERTPLLSPEAPPGE